MVYELIYIFTFALNLALTTSLSHADEMWLVAKREFCFLQRNVQAHVSAVARRASALHIWLPLEPDIQLMQLIWTGKRIPRLFNVAMAKVKWGYGIPLLFLIDP